MFLSIGTLAELKQHILYELGYPVKDVELDDYHLLSAINKACKRFVLFHFDGAQAGLYKLNISNNVLEYTLPNNIVAVLYPINTKYSGLNIDDEAYAMQFQTSLGIGGMNNNLIDYTVTNQYLNMAEATFKVMPKFSYNSTTKKLVFFENPVGKTMQTFLYFVCYQSSAMSITGKTFPTGQETALSVTSEIFQNDWVQRYAVEQARLTWGLILSKYSNVNLVGGATFNGESIRDYAIERIKELEEELGDMWSEPIGFFVQ